MDEDTIEPIVDDSRPFYHKKKCRIGLYIEVYDAKPLNPKAFGSEHFFLMNLKDILRDYFDEFDLVKAKGVMERRNVCKGVILEQFEHGLVLTLAFDNVDALESIWKLHCSKKLTPLVQDMLVNSVLLKTADIRKITLQAKLWEDEYEECKVELLTSRMERVSLKKSHNGMNLVRRIRDAQKDLHVNLSKARDEESEFELNLGELIMDIKKIIPTNVTAIHSLKELTTNYKMAKGAELKGFENIEHYFKTLEMLREIFTDIEKTILHPLAQIHTVCETSNQRAVKKSIIDTHVEMVKRLRPDQDLENIVHKEWEKKILFRERKLFLGMVSLVPMSVEKIVDIDHMIDEYITAYPEKLKL